jgi:low temperature requirement protein LtrA
MNLSLISFAPRDNDDSHRAATPLELMFDLASVVAIAAAAAGLHHGVAEAHFASALIGYFAAFFMIWWAWMNYTWFASAYDDGSTLFRVMSMAVMFGALMLAAGVPAVFAGERIWLALFGFVIMRTGMVVFWLAAARGDPERRRTAMHYAAGIALMQLYWIMLVVLVPPAWSVYLPLLFLGFAGELLVPAIAERQKKTTWHRDHIVERYSLMNIIVLGECFLAIVALIQLESGGALPRSDLLWIAAYCAVITFSMWGLYFTAADHLRTDELGHALLWGYGHFALFAAGAATGAGFAVMKEVATHHAQVDMRVASISVAIPVAIYVATLWVIRDRFHFANAVRWLLPGSALLILIAGTMLPESVLVIALILVVTLVLRRVLHRTPEEVTS